MIDLNDIAHYLASVKSPDADAKAGSLSSEEIQSVVCELQDSILNDQRSIALLGQPVAEIAKPELPIGRQYFLALTPLRLTVLFLVTLGSVGVLMGAARRSLIHREREQLEPLYERTFVLAHSIEDNIDSLSELEYMLRYVDANQVQYQENRDAWKALRVGLNSIIVLEQAKKGRFDDALSLAQTTVEESRYLNAGESQQIPAQSLAHYALARTLFDKGRRVAGSLRTELLEAALTEIDRALSWTESDLSSRANAETSPIAITYHARLIELQAYVLHKLVRRDKAQSAFADALQQLMRVPTEQRDWIWHLTASRIYADQGVAFTSDHQEALARQSLESGLDILKQVDDANAAWMKGLIQSNYADLCQVLGHTEEEIAGRLQAIEDLRQAMHRSGMTASIEENLILNYARLALAYLRKGDQERSEITIHRLQGLSNMQMPFHQMGDGDRARVAVMIASDPLLSPDKRDEHVQVFASSLETMKRERPNWSSATVAFENTMWQSLGPHLTSLPIELVDQLQELLTPNP